MPPLKPLFATAMLRAFGLFAAGLVCLALTGTTQAGISVSPLSSILDLNNSKSKILTVFNTSPAKSVAIKVTVRSWRLDKQGNDIRKASEDLLIFPGQFVLPPLSRRSIRISYQPPQAPPIEKSYRVIVQQVPVNLAGNNKVQTGVNLVISYATAFYVEPSSAMSEVALEQVSVDAKKLHFTLNNSGNAHTHLRQAQIVITQDKQRFMITQPKALKGIFNANMLAGSQREFSLVWPESVSQALDFKAPMELELSLACESCASNSAVLRAPIE
jgi:fimbrial chaperone protein